MDGSDSKSYSYRCPKNEPKRNPSVVYNVVDAVLVWVGFFFFLSWFINTVVYVWDMGIPLQLPLLCSYHSLSHRAPKVVVALFFPSLSVPPSSSCKSIMQSSFSPYPTHLSNLASAPSSFSPAQYRQVDCLLLP